MAQADCVVLMLASAATIRVVLLTAGSIESADPIASRRRWGTLPKHMLEQSSSWSAVPKIRLSGGVRFSVR
jgi:hypothetical protein